MNSWCISQLAHPDADRSVVVQALSCPILGFNARPSDSFVELRVLLWSRTPVKGPRQAGAWALLAKLLLA